MSETKPCIRLVYRNPQPSTSRISASALRRSPSSVKPRKWRGAPLMPSLADQLQLLAKLDRNAFDAIRGFVAERLAKHVAAKRHEPQPKAATPTDWGWRPTRPKDRTRRLIDTQ